MQKRAAVRWMHCCGQQELQLFLAHCFVVPWGGVCHQFAVVLETLQRPALRGALAGAALRCCRHPIGLALPCQ